MTSLFPSSSPTPRAWARIEWPTVLLAVVIYGAWLAATRFHAALPWPARVALGGWLIAWQGSLQHETIHGHPTPWRRVNALIGGIPLSLWLPYARYRQTHIAHHATEHVTEPGVDPESRYLRISPTRLGKLKLSLGRLQSTLVGRLVLGPVVDVIRFLVAEVSAFREAPGKSAGLWAVHLLAAAPLVAWLTLVCHMSLIDYLSSFILPGAALTLVRSFAEHRADEEPGHRVAVVEAAPVFGLLFLNNNLHAVHHRRPGLAWYRLPQAYRGERDAVLADNGGLVYRGYAEVFKRYAFRPCSKPRAAAR